MLGVCIIQMFEYFKRYKRFIRRPSREQMPRGPAICGVLGGPGASSPQNVISCHYYYYEHSEGSCGVEGGMALNVLKSLASKKIITFAHLLCLYFKNCRAFLKNNFLKNI